LDTFCQAFEDSTLSGLIVDEVFSAEGDAHGSTSVYNSIEGPVNVSKETQGAKGMGRPGTEKAEHHCLLPVSGNMFREILPVGEERIIGGE
jgi:hypothetical protein